MKNMSLNDGAPTIFLLTPLREGRPAKTALQSPRCAIFLLTPLREGRLLQRDCGRTRSPISTHAPAGGATNKIVLMGRLTRISTHAPAGGATFLAVCRSATGKFLLTPLREGRRRCASVRKADGNFYSRPCGRGDHVCQLRTVDRHVISTHAPAGGATLPLASAFFTYTFLLTPLREGRQRLCGQAHRLSHHFYSRPCGRGDHMRAQLDDMMRISTHAPAGGATKLAAQALGVEAFLLTPLREGRPCRALHRRRLPDFYSRPCGRGDPGFRSPSYRPLYFYSRPCGRGDGNFPQVRHEVLRQIAER